MPQHEEKICPRCEAQFECKVGSINLCQCQTVSLDEAEMDYIRKKFDDCLCADCLLSLKKEYKQQLLEEKINRLLWLFQHKNTFQEMSKNKDNLNNLLCLDVFLMGLSPQERQYLSNQILPNRSVGHILLSFDIISFGFEKLREQISNKAMLEKFAKKFNWQIDLKKILLNDFEALVLTNVEREILWVDKGFEKMTGYTAQEAVGKKPTFLQGKNTQESTRLLFREKLALQIPFDITVTNYRKNEEEYLCKVQIFPLFNKHKKISHFLALEQEIK